MPALTWLTGSPSVAYEPWEVPHTASENWASDKLTASVKLMAAWVDRYTVMENILANNLPWPYHAAGTPLRAVSGVIGSFNGERSETGYEPGGNAFEDCELTVNFEAVSATIGESPVIYSESIEPTADYLTIPTKKIRWGSVTGDIVTEPPGFLLTGFDYKLTFYNVATASIPDAFVSLTGCVNDAVVPTSMFGDLGIEHVLYNPPTMNRSVSYGSANRWTLSMRLTFKPYSWNKFYRPSSNSFEHMYHEDGGGTALKPYVPADFSPILP